MLLPYNSYWDHTKYIKTQSKVSQSLTSLPKDMLFSGCWTHRGRRKEGYHLCTRQRWLEDLGFWRLHLRLLEFDIYVFADYFIKVQSFLLTRVDSSWGTCCFLCQDLSFPYWGLRCEPHRVRQGQPQRGVQRLLHHQLPGSYRPRLVEGTVSIEVGWAVRVGKRELSIA